MWKFSECLETCAANTRGVECGSNEGSTPEKWVKLLIDYFFSCICTLIPRTLPLNTLWTWKWSSANRRKGSQRTSNYYYPMRKQHYHSDKCHVTLSVVREPYVALKRTYLKPRARSIRGDGKLFPPPPSFPQHQHFMGTHSWTELREGGWMCLA